MKKYNFEKIINIIKKRMPFDKIDFAFVLGSGINIEQIIEDKVVISYTKLKMPSSKVKGHSGSFIFGKIGNKNIVCASRYHFYECSDMQQVILPFQILNRLGVKSIILQSSTAGVNSSFKIADIVNIIDHINYTGNNPLLYTKEIKFVNMSNAYDDTYIKEIQKAYKLTNLDYKTSTHIQFSGPNYETSAEINLAKKLGADTISMSLVYDNLICNYYGMKVLAFAVITNIASKTNIKTLSHNEVLENCKLANSNFIKLIKQFLNNI